MTSKSLPKPPGHLSPAIKKWWGFIVREFELEQHHLRLLRLACEAWDRCQQCREIIDRDGVSYVDRFGAPRLRPECAVERDSRTAFARLVRELNLDSAPGPDSPRPPSLNR